jgi:uncharacterized protein YndB with AHSA1/START domain
MKTMRCAAVLLVALVFPGAAAAKVLHSPHVTIVQSDQPVKRLDWEVTVPASIDRVWAAFTTQDGMMSWLAPQTRAELKPGGDWRASFPGYAEAGGNILAFQPNTLLVLSAMAPEKFPTVRSERTLAVFAFTPHGDSETIVHLSQTGWKSGAEWDAAYDYLTNGNTQLLEALYQRFATGNKPVKWSS